MILSHETESSVETQRCGMLRDRLVVVSMPRVPAGGAEHSLRTVPDRGRGMNDEARMGY